MLGDNWPYPRVIEPAPMIRESLNSQSRPAPDPFGDRGVVLLPAWRNANEQTFSRREAEYALLRKALLYWDVICWPQLQQPPIHATTPIERILFRLNELPEPELELLRKEGVLLHMPVTVMPDRWGQLHPIRPESIFSQHIDIYLNLEYHDPGCWTIGEAADRFVVPSGLVPVKEGALWSLTNLLPAPALGTGHLEILDFRRRHKQELLQLRAQLDECLGQIRKNPDSAHVYGAAHRRLDSAIADVWKAIERERKKFVRSTLRIAIAMLEGGCHGEIVSELLPLPRADAAIAGAAVGGAVLGGIEFVKELLMPNPTGLAGPCGYLYPYLSAAKESGIVMPV